MWAIETQSLQPSIFCVLCVYLFIYFLYMLKMDEVGGDSGGQTVLFTPGQFYYGVYICCIDLKCST